MRKISVLLMTMLAILASTSVVFAGGHGGHRGGGYYGHGGGYKHHRDGGRDGLNLGEALLGAAIVGAAAGATEALISGPPPQVVYVQPQVTYAAPPPQRWCTVEVASGCYDQRGNFIQTGQGFRTVPCE